MTKLRVAKVPREGASMSQSCRHRKCLQEQSPKIGQSRLFGSFCQLCPGPGIAAWPTHHSGALPWSRDGRGPWPQGATGSREAQRETRLNRALTSSQRGAIPKQQPGSRCGDVCQCTTGTYLCTSAASSVFDLHLSAEQMCTCG